MDVIAGLQISGNALMPLLQFLGNSIADRYPTHGEQYNQNINSQGYNSAYLALQTVSVMTHHTAISLLIFVQACDLRSNALTHSYDASKLLSPASASLYHAVKGMCLYCRMYMYTSGWQ